MQSVKQERHDEAEIQELAAKMVEANRAKMSSIPQRPQMPQCQNVNILNFLTNPNKKNTTRIESTAAAAVASTSSEGSIDDESVRGRFGWTTLGAAHIPYIFRSGDKYCAVRMVEVKLLNKYLNFLHQDIYNCTCIRSYYITDAEGRLLNEINVRHCDYQFGREQFTTRDLIVRLSDAEEFYNFLDACYNKLLSGNQNVADRCGFIRINQESVVPYTVYSNQKYVPLFYFEGETDNLKLKAEKLEGWDLSYLKFCCKVQGIRNELFAHDSCSVISLNDIKNYFPPGTLFEDYWPKKTLDSQLLINGKAQTQMIQWTKTPVAPPITTTTTTPSPKPATQAKAPGNNQQQMQNVQAMYTNYGMTPGQPPPYHVPQPRTASSPVRPTYAPSSAVGRQIRPSYYTNMSQAPTQPPPPPPPPLVRSTQP